MLGLIVAVVVLVVALFMTYRNMRYEVAKLEASLSWYKNWFRIRQGSFHGIGAYYIASFDCGRTWYDVEPTDDPCIEVKKNLHAGRFGYKILRPASDVLLAKLTQWDELTELVERTS